MWQIDSKNITNYNASRGELQSMIIFWVLAAGKTAKTAEKILANLIPKRDLPFSQLEKYSQKKLSEKLKSLGCGCYNAKSRTIYELIHSKLNLSTCEISDLEKIYGIGRKTSRGFVLHSRKNAQCAVLDVHLLRYLKYNNIHNVPTTTPSSKTEYLRLEKSFLLISKKLRIKPSKLDLEIWKLFSEKIDFQNEKFDKYRFFG